MLNKVKHVSERVLPTNDVFFTYSDGDSATLINPNSHISTVAARIL